jgi:hypothetical protein
MSYYKTLKLDTSTWDLMLDGQGILRSPLTVKRSRRMWPAPVWCFMANAISIIPGYSVETERPGQIAHAGVYRAEDAGRSQKAGDCGSGCGECFL